MHYRMEFGDVDEKSGVHIKIVDTYFAICTEFMVYNLPNKRSFLPIKGQTTFKAIPDQIKHQVSSLLDVYFGQTWAWIKG